MAEKKKILIVEDETPLREALRDKLNREGYQAIEATDGEDGLAKATQEHPDLIMTDIMMPKMDGFALLGKLQADTNLNTIPVVIISNLGQDTDRDQAKKLGAKEFFVKADMPVADIITYVNTLFGDK